MPVLSEPDYRRYQRSESEIRIAAGALVQLQQQDTKNPTRVDRFFNATQDQGTKL
jgi:hypothetical protein